jgi:NAD(P)-dependent dehydrogenase (short-subunit alcohol dehydrogenase family)
MARKKLQGQAAIVTGGSRGIGAAAAEQLAQAGAAVVIAARSEEQVEAVAKRLRSSGARAIGVAADVSDLEQVEEVVEAALSQFDRIDIVVNNAAIIWPIEQAVYTDPEEWAYAIHVNLIGAFYMAHNVLQVMLDQRYGRIINISSAAAVRPAAGMSAYCVSKAGLDMLTRTLALEIDGTGVTVNAHYPGMVDTDMQTDIRSVDTSESDLDFTFWHEYYDQGRLTSPAESARQILWLAGPWSRNYNGQIFDSNDPAWLEQVKRDLGD